MGKLTDRSLPAQEFALLAHLVVPDGARGGRLPLRNYLEVSGWGFDIADRAHRESEESGVNETVCAHVDQIAPASCLVNDSPPELGKGEVKGTGEDDNHHDGGGKAHRENH
jgi:hypothetical protein